VQNGFFQNQETLETPYPENVFERPRKKHRMRAKEEKKTRSTPLRSPRIPKKGRV
jgi:hypothetical protein